MRTLNLFLVALSGLLFHQPLVGRHGSPLSPITFQNDSHDIKASGQIRHFDLSGAEDWKENNLKLLRDQEYFKKVNRSSGKPLKREDYTEEELREIVEAFETSGGRVLFVPDSDQVRMTLPKKKANYYPICKGGINRSQITYHVLKRKGLEASGSKIWAPHGTHLGYESPHTAPLSYEFAATEASHGLSNASKIYIDRIGGNRYFETSIGEKRPKRFGHELFADHCRDPKIEHPKWGISFHNCRNRNQQFFFNQSYWNPSTTMQKIYITFGSSGIHTLLRAQPRSSVVVILPIEDLVHKSGNKGPQDEKEVTAAYRSLYQKIDRLFLVGTKEQEWHPT